MRNTISASAKKIFYILFFLSNVALAQNSGKIYNIKDYGAVGDGKTLNTDAINKAITACADNGGGTVFVPAGNFVTGTVLFKSNITLNLDPDSHIIGTTDITQYKSYKLRKQDPNEPINITVRDSSVWTTALILLDKVHDVAITGTGTIDGAGVTDKRGEEGRRGPHGIFIAESKNIAISDIRVMRSGNYNIIGLYVENIKLTGITISQGSDGIHIRKGKNILIDNCKFYTGDDSIAGGYWENAVISNCIINSACNGIRVILPATNLEIKDCEIFGPGVFGHPRGTPINPLVTRTLTGIILQPGAWGLGGGKLAKIYIHNIHIRDVQTAMTLLLNKGNQGEDIRVEDVVATGITNNAISVEAWPEGSTFDQVKFKNVSVSYKILNPGVLKTSEITRLRTESRPLPYWGFYARNVKNIEFDNVKFDYAGTESRPVMGFDMVSSVSLKNVKYKKVTGVEPLVYSKDTKVVTVSSSSF
jgi:polygalacturonase